MQKELFKDLFLDTFWEIIYFPVWWYSRGLKKTAIFCLKQVKVGWQALALGILLANFFKPMYGEGDLVGYVLSFLVRLVQLAWRLLFMLLWLGLWLVAFVLWLILPPSAIWKLIIG